MERAPLGKRMAAMSRPGRFRRPPLWKARPAVATQPRSLGRARAWQFDSAAFLHPFQAIHCDFLDKTVEIALRLGSTFRDLKSCRKSLELEYRVCLRQNHERHPADPRGRAGYVREARKPARWDSGRRLHVGGSQFHPSKPRHPKGSWGFAVLGAKLNWTQHLTTDQEDVGSNPIAPATTETALPGRHPQEGRHTL